VNETKEHKPRFVHKWPLSRKSIGRVAISRFAGRDVIDVRIWWRRPNGEHGATKRGLTVDVCQLPALARALVKAKRKARKLGLIAKKTRR
jgi:hypothetical protein